MTDRSARRRILLSRDTLLGLVVVLLLAAVCVSLGLWQYGRFEDKRDRAAVIEENYDASAVSLAEAMPDPAAPLPDAQVWTPVEMQGSYCTDPGCVLYVRNRQLGGEVGFWQLVPFSGEDGTTLMIVRGWVPEDADASSPADPAPVPEGTLTVTARLRTAEPVLDRVPPEGQAHSVNPTQIASQLGLDTDAAVIGAFGELAQEEPAADRPQPLPAPETGLGPHLSYAFQWWIFALFFPGALIFRLRRQFQDLAAEEAEAAAGASPGADEDGAPGAIAASDPHAAAPASRTPVRSGARDTADHRPRRAVRARRRGQDEEEEDALIDQQQP
ncbi:SURF1 family cytochrome oxidase biogenesis protein [Brachybacterium paraconglomeratum]|uniref:SURF1 family cytochrome oxidase biogenesis protein n=1 Tax=Brachybacterium paraconglomeratum TaxID=173362 RepID=UPI003810AC28